MTRPFPKSETPANLPVGERWLAAVPALAAIAIAVGSRIGPLVKDLAPAWLIPQAPIAPLVADAMWLLGVALIVLNWRHRLPAWRVIAAGAAGLLIVGLVVFGAQARSITSVSLGLMAAVVLLMALAPDRRSRFRAGGLVVALFLLTGHGIILLGHHFNVSLVGDPQLAPAAWTTALALTALSFALVITCGASGWFVRDILGEATDDKRLVPHLVKRQRRLALLVLGLVCTVVATGGYLYLRSAIQQQRANLAAELTQIAELKTAQIEAWLRERKADTIALAQAPLLPGDRAGFERYLEGLRRAYGYRGITVFDRTWIPVATAPAGAPGVLPAGLIEQAMQAPEIFVEDLAQEPDGTAGMGFIALRRTPDGAFAGAVRLRMDAAVQLFPIIQSWPVKSETAESIMVRRDGLTVLALNNLRFRPDTALRLRYPLGQRDLPAAIAALDRRVDLSEGVDYRGEPVLWLSRPVAGTAWVLLAKMDQVEAYAALRAAAWRVAGGFAVGLLAVGLLIGNYWRSRQRYYERQHVEAEEERRVAVERLAVVLKHAQDVILLIDEHMQVVEVNDRALQVYDRTPLEMRQLSVLDLRAEQLRETVKADFDRALTSEGITFETLHRRKDGSVFPVEVSSAAVEIEGRRHVLSIVRDISRRKAMEDELKRQEARFRFIFEHAPVGICLEVGDCEVLANEEHVRITGVAAKDSGIPGIFTRTSHPEDYARQLRALGPFQRGEVDEFIFEKRYLHPDGRTVWARMNSHWLVDPASGTRRWLTILSDITEQKSQEEELRRQSAKFRFIFDHLPVGVSLRTQATGLEVNPAHERITGVAAADSNRPGAFAEVTHPEDYARQLKVSESFIRGEVDSFTLEKRYLQPGGRVVWVEFTSHWFLEPATGERQALTTITDISQRKAIEEELKRQEARFRFIFERAPVGISLILETGEVMVNETHARISGVPVKDSNIPGIFGRASHPEDYARQLVAAAPFARNEIDQYTFEKRYLHADGRTVWARLTSHWFIDPATRQRQVLTIVSDISEQKRIETELRRQGAKFQFIYDHLPVGVSLWTQASGLELNPAFIRISGIEAAEANRPGVFTRATHPEDHARQREITERFNRGEIDQFSLEKRYIHPDGAVIWVEYTCHRFTEPVTGELQTLTTVTDITERKAAEEALQSREEIFSNIVNQAMDAMALIDPVTARFIEFNRAAHEGLGYTREEFAAHGVGGIQAEHSAAEIGANVGRIMTEGSATFETRHRHRNGELRDVRVSARKFTLRGQDCIAAVWTDITDAKRLTRELQASEALHRALFENMDLGVVYQDASGAITAANSAAIRILGLSFDQMRGLTSTDPAWRAVREDGSAFPGEEHPAMVALRTGQRVQDVVMGIRTAADRPVRWILTHAVPEFHAGEARPHRVFTIFADISERKQTEQALRDSEAGLRATQQIARIGGWWLDGATQKVTWTDQIFRMLALTPDQSPPSGAELGRYFTAEGWEKLSQAINRALTEGVSYEVEVEMIRADGTRGWMLAFGDVQRDARGAITGLHGVAQDVTERKQAQLALEASEAKFRRLLEMVPLPLGHADKDGRISFTNERFLRIFGYTPADVPTVEAWWQRAYPDPQYRAELAALWERALRQAVATNGEIVPMESRITCKDGSVRTVEISGMVLGEETLVAFVDITERVKTERKLRQQSRIIEQAPLSIAITDLTGAIEYVNPRFCEVTGYTLEEVLDQNPRVLKSGKTAPEVYTQMWQALSRGEVWRGELCNKKKNGDLYYEQAVIAPVTDEGGAITHYVALKEDITVRKSREDALRETQERYRLIAENTNDTIWLYDLATERFTYCSPSILKLRGYTVEEMLGQKMADSLTPASAAQVARLLPDRVARFAAGDLSVRTEINELEQVHRDGHIIATEVSTTLLADASGHATQILGVTRDITERRRAAKALQESRDRLVQAEQIARLGNWSLELATGAVTWSDEMYRLLELDPATTTPSVELYHSFLPPEDRDLLQRRFAEVLETRQRFVLGTRLILRSGQVKFAEGTGEVIVDAAGRPVRAIGTVQDVTDRRLIEIELHELVKGLRVLRAISQALEQRNLDRTALLALVVRELPAAMKYPADARAEIVIEGQRQEAGAPGTPLARLTVPISINDRVAGEVAVGYVQPHAAGDEGPFHVREREVLESIARTIGLGLGEREAFAAVRQFNAELEGKVAARTAELAARNRQIQSLFATIPDTVLRVGTDGVVLFSQRAPESPRLAAITPLPNTVPSYQATADFLAACRELGRRARAENGTVAGDIEVGTPGGPVAIELRAAPTGTEEFVVFARDISARKRLEAEVTAMLAKEREISEMKTRFISVTSHEFRTPMAAALGSVELLHNHFARMTPEKREELFTRIYGSLHRMTDMLDDILLLNRMDANRVEVRPAVIDLRKFVHSAVDEIRLGDRENHHFALEAEGELAEFVSDPNLLHHILSNLLSNAVRYSPAGTTVTTRVTATAAAATIAVEDQGIGIPEADRQRIFEPFERGTNVGQIKGTGLGLNIVKRMIGLLGGTIGLESVPGGGSRFQVVLPRSAPPASPS